VPDAPTVPVFPVVFDEPAIAKDLAHHPPVARHALELIRRGWPDRGVPTLTCAHAYPTGFATCALSRRLRHGDVARMPRNQAAP
jgi:hypothetical protein